MSKYKFITLLTITGCLMIMMAMPCESARNTTAPYFLGDPEVKGVVQCDLTVQPIRFDAPKMITMHVRVVPETVGQTEDEIAREMAKYCYDHFEHWRHIVGHLCKAATVSCNDRKFIFATGINTAWLWNVRLRFEQYYALKHNLSTQSSSAWSTMQYVTPTPNEVLARIECRTENRHLFDDPAKPPEWIIFYHADVIPADVVSTDVEANTDVSIVEQCYYHHERWTETVGHVCHAITAPCDHEHLRCYGLTTERLVKLRRMYQAYKETEADDIGRTQWCYRYEKHHQRDPIAYPKTTDCEGFTWHFESQRQKNIKRELDRLRALDEESAVRHKCSSVGNNKQLPECVRLANDDLRVEQEKRVKAESEARAMAHLAAAVEARMAQIKARQEAEAEAERKEKEARDRAEALARERAEKRAKALLNAIIERKREHDLQFGLQVELDAKLAYDEWYRAEEALLAPAQERQPEPRQEEETPLVETHRPTLIVNDKEDRARQLLLDIHSNRNLPLSHRGKTHKKLLSPIEEEAQKPMTTTVQPTEGAKDDSFETNTKQSLMSPVEHQDLVETDRPTLLIVNDKEDRAKQLLLDIHSNMNGSQSPMLTQKNEPTNVSPFEQDQKPMTTTTVQPTTTTVSVKVVSFETNAEQALMPPVEHHQYLVETRQTIVNDKEDRARQLLQDLQQGWKTSQSASRSSRKKRN